MKIKIKNIIKYLKDKLNSTYPPFRNLLDASWNTYESEELEKIGFEYCTFKSNLNNIIIEIEKFYDQEVPGYASNLYGISIRDNKIESYTHECFDDFDIFISYIKSYIPEVELKSNLYNL